MTSKKIVQAALKSFAQCGYETTILAEIADEVGIRKPSIYAHFSSKKQLFMHILDTACRQELDYIAITFTETSLAPLKRYVFEILERFTINEYLLFWLRALYLPPWDLANELKEYDKRYVAGLDQAIAMTVEVVLDQAKKHCEEREMFVEGYTGIVRAMHAELLYHGPDKAMLKTQAMWKIFERAMQGCPECGG